MADPHFWGSAIHERIGNSHFHYPTTMSNTLTPEAPFTAETPPMARVWKVASRWSTTGSPESSVLDIFRKHNVVFVGKFQDRFCQIGVGDLIAISDGKMVVAMGLATTLPSPITELGIDFSEEDKACFDCEDYVLGCRVSFTDLNQDERRSYRVSTFHSVNERADEFREIYRKHHQCFEEEQQFEISARSCTLMHNDRNSKDILWQENLFFQVPIYQRPYSWEEAQVRKLVADVLAAFHGRNGAVQKEPIFIGTMQITDSRLFDGLTGRMFHEVIDGQQRISTLILILKVLKDRYSEDSFLRELDLMSRLQTRVSSGEQQKYLIQALETDTTLPIEPGQNPYLKVVPLIIRLIENDEPTEETDGGEAISKTEVFDASGFVAYLVSRVYFVVIETRATLSKTLQIFDAINTSGMDLNGGDIFKVRYYEYLRRLKKADEDVFEEISALYQVIDEKNRDAGWDVTSIENILSLAQHVLIARHEMPKVLHDYGSATFFDRLFDTVLHINSWPNYSPESASKVEIKISELAQLVEARYRWQHQLGCFGSEARCAMDFIWWSRYGKYAYLPILFQLRFGADIGTTERFVIQLSKLFILFSVWRRRAVYELHSLMHELQDQLFATSSTHSAEDVIRFIHELCLEKKGEITWALANEPIAGIAKTKALVCRLSALMDEILEGNRQSEEIRSLLFDTEIDIEHIESVNHKDGTKREQIWTDWGDDLHQIGNLIVLEMDVNRSISNEAYAQAKLPAYKQSEFCIVQKHAKEFPIWNLEACKCRKEKEVNRLVSYLCGNDLLRCESGRPTTE